MRPYTQGVAVIPPEPDYSTAHDIPRGAPPSTYAVVAFLEGEKGSTAKLIGVTFLRAVFIIPGLWLTGKVIAPELKGWRVPVLSIGASTTISLGLLLWYWIRKRAQSPAEMPNG